MKKFLYLLPVLAALFFTSCNDDDNETKDLIETEYVNKITTDESSEIRMARCRYFFEINYTKMTANIAILNFREEASMDQANEIVLTEIPLKYTAQDGYNFTLPAPVNPQVNGKTDPSYTVNALAASFKNTEWKVNYMITTPRGNFNVNGVIRTQKFLFTKSEVSGMGEPFTWEKASYDVTLEPEKSTARLVLDNIKFADKMPALDGMEFQNIKIVPTETGFDLSAKEIIPMHNHTQMPEHKITNLTGDIKGSTFTCSFTYGGKLNVNLTGNMHPKK